MNRSPLETRATVGRERADRLANIDWFIFATSVVCVAGVCVPLALYPEAGRELLALGFAQVTHRYGVVFILFSVGTLVLLGYLAFGRYGRIVLGQPGQQPEYTTFSWAAMLFCGGIGATVLYWGTLEWAHYYQTPPFGIEPHSGGALVWAGSYPLFHWGFIGWGLYVLPAIPLAYAYYVRRIPKLRLSTACVPVLGRHATGAIGRVVDLLFVVSLLGAASTGIGLTVPLLAACANHLFGVDDTFALKVVVILTVTSLFAASVYAGLDAGIKRLSNVNVGVAFGLLAFVLVVGPTGYIAETAIESVGHMFQNFIRMSTYTDPGETSDFVESWTVFYWAWWLALAPGMGIFIARISRGRTIREVILGSVCYGTAGTALFFLVLGGYAMWLETQGELRVLTLMNDSGPPATIIAVLGELPLGSVVVPVFAMLCLIFAATSYDSSSYSLASTTTYSLPAGEHPARWNRLFWAFTLGALPITLVYIGGLRSLQSAVVIAAVPLLGVVTLMTVSLFRGLRQDAANDGDPVPVDR